MSQHETGYARKERDLYETPEWVTAALVPHLPTTPCTIWEPAAASGKMVAALRHAGYIVVSTDIADGHDFLKAAGTDAEVIATNPPYALAQQFIEHALRLMKTRGSMAMLLRTDYDHARGRRHLFSGCTAFAKKVVLTRRIVWFDGPKAAPSFNHGWYIWSWRHQGAPVLAYGPEDAQAMAYEGRKEVKT
jgi:hypothetical protein